MNTPTKKLTVLIEADVYRALQKQVGRGNIGRFLSDVARPHLLSQEALREGYKKMAADKEYNREALEWTEAMIGDLDI